MNDAVILESGFTRRMKEEYIWFIRMSVFFGLIYTICLYENMSGITFPLMTMLLLVFSTLFLKKAGISIKKGSVRYAAGILLLGISTCLTDSLFFHFFNNAGILLLFMMGIAHQLYDDGQWGFAEYVKKFFIMIGTWVLSMAAPFKFPVKTVEESSKKRWIKGKTVKAVIPGIAAAMLFFLIVLPLLISSDRIFEEVFYSVFRHVDLKELFRRIDLGNVAGIFFTFFFVTVMFYAFFAGMFRMNLGGREERISWNVSQVTGITFAAIIAVVYVMYSVIQILFLFLKLDGGLPEGMTYSQYAHQGFWQLLAVSIINFTAVLICMQVFLATKGLKSLLCVISLCTCVMILSAGYRMVLYVREYNLTFLRVLVLWFLGVLMLIFFGVIYSIFRQEFRLFRYITLVVSVCYIAFSLIHTDRVIAEYNIANTEKMNENDLNYLMYGLSKDAAPALAKIDVAHIENQWMDPYLKEYFDGIRKTNENNGIREWNYSRTAAYKAAEEWKQQE